MQTLKYQNVGGQYRKTTQCTTTIKYSEQVAIPKTEKVQVNPCINTSKLETFLLVGMLEEK